MELRLHFGQCSVQFLADSYIPWDERLDSFRETDPGRKPDLIYTIQPEDVIGPKSGICIRTTMFYKVYQDGCRETRYYTFPDGMIYAACREEDDTHFTILYLREFLAYLQGSATLFYLSAMESRLVSKGNMILHSSFILDEGRALLFAAPAGTGKSTQANLWKECRGSRIMNGDRALLDMRDGLWEACGWPMSGSSGVSKNCRCPIRAVILLDRSQKNIARRLSPEEAFDMSCREIVVRPWNNREVEEATKLLRQFCQQVPVYTYHCCKDKSAVDDLYAALQADHLYDA